MAEVIRMPLLSDTMKEGKIASWLKKVGDTVKSDDAIAEVETDKATMEVMPYVDGTLLYIGVEAGKAAKVDGIIAIIGKPGEDISALIANETKEQATVHLEMPAQTATTVATTPTVLAPLPKGVTVVRMPLLSDTMKEGKIVSWNKKEGDIVKSDDVLADVETDKATMEVMGYADGVLLHIGVTAGNAAKINEIICIVGPAGTDISSILAQEKQAILTPNTALPQATIANAVIANTVNNTTSSAPSNTTNGRLKISPLAKKIAQEKGVDIQQLHGTGDGGRIILRDVQTVQVANTMLAKTAISTSPAFVPSSTESYNDVPVTQMRKIIAEKLSNSLFTAPHFYLTTSITLDNLLATRKQINDAQPVKISINDMLIKACALSLRQHPDVNSSWMGDFIRYNHHISIGSAVALPDGLIVPVIKFADQKTLAQIATDANELYDKAKNKKIQPAEFTGNTFTISNLGMMDIDEFTAIINPPDACILAVGKGAQTPVVENGAVVIRTVMKLTLSCDHRVVDGAVGARFLQTLKGYLENPITILL